MVAQAENDNETMSQGDNMEEADAENALGSQPDEATPVLDHPKPTLIADTT